MNKTDLVAAVAEKAGLPKTQTMKAVDAMLEVIEGTLKKGEGVQLIGFGTFSVVQRAARVGVNPATKQKINIPAKKAVIFKVGSKLAI